MALIKCRECGNEISDKAISCPNCGCPIAAEESGSMPGTSVNENTVAQMQGSSTTCEIQSPVMDAKEAKKLKKRKSKYEKRAEFFTGEILLIGFIVMIFGVRILAFRIAVFSQIIGIIYYIINISSKEGTHKTFSGLAIVVYSLVFIGLAPQTIIKPQFKAATNTYVATCENMYQDVIELKSQGINKNTNAIYKVAAITVLQADYELFKSSSNSLNAFRDSSTICENLYYSKIVNDNQVNEKMEIIKAYFDSFN